MVFLILVTGLMHNWSVLQTSLKKHPLFQDGTDPSMFLLFAFILGVRCVNFSQRNTFRVQSILSVPGWRPFGNARHGASYSAEQT